jgi:hypothetical protein
MYTETSNTFYYNQNEEEGRHFVVLKYIFLILSTHPLSQFLCHKPTENTEHHVDMWRCIHKIKSLCTHRIAILKTEAKALGVSDL